MATNLVFSVQKALAILDLLIFEDADKNGLRLSEISQKTGIKPNTLHNLLRTMISKNYVQQYENNNYSAGTKIDQIHILGQLNSDEHRYGPLSVLENLRDDIQENVVFAVLSGGKWKLVKEFPYESAIQINNGKFVNSNIFEKATGRVMTAYCSDKELNEILSVHGMPKERWDYINSLDILNEARRFVRKKGWFDMYTQNDQLWAIGIPVLNNKGSLVGAIGCAAPAFRCDDIRKEYIKKQFMKVASELKGIMHADK